MRHFLWVIDRKERRRTLDRIREARIAQLETKAYKETIRKLEQQNRLLELRHARVEGRQVGHRRTPEEEERLKQQQHVCAEQMTSEEKSPLEREREQMWAGIPAHVRAKSEALLRGH